MSLGEAFIEIRADLRPFARDLRRSVKPIADAFEKELTGAVSKAAAAEAEKNGRNIGDSLSRGMKRSIGNQFKDKNIFIGIAAALGSALDDGLSALPTEVKAAIVAGLILAAPILAAFLTGVLTAGIGVGVAALGVALASQFEEVQTFATETGRNIRNILVESASSFGQAIIDSLRLVEVRLKLLQPVFKDIFDISATFLEPLVQGSLDGLRELVESIRNSLGNIKPFIDELGAGIAIILDGVGQAIEILARSGDDGVKALRDLARIIQILIVSVAVALTAFTKLYGIIRDIIVAINQFTGGLSIPLILLGKFFEATDNGSNRLRSFANTNTDLGNSFHGVIEGTKGEAKALKMLADALDGASDAAKSNLELNLAWEESLDRISESLEENGRSLDIHTDKGQANINAFLEGLKVAEERAVLRVQRGELTARQAADQYAREVVQLRNLATQAGLSGAAFDALYQEIILTAEARISASDMGITDLNSEIARGAAVAAELARQLQFIKNLQISIGSGAVGGVSGFADGGIQYLPTTANIAEDGPEVIIPLTKPARAAQLMRESGLSSMISGNNNSQVLVFIGNEQLEARTVKVVERSNAGQATALTQGPRRF